MSGLLGRHFSLLGRHFNDFGRFLSFLGQLFSLFGQHFNDFGHLLGFLVQLLERVSEFGTRSVSECIVLSALLRIVLKQGRLRRLVKALAHASCSELTHTLYSFRSADWFFRSSFRLIRDSTAQLFPVRGNARRGRGNKSIGRH